MKKKATVLGIVLSLSIILTGCGGNSESYNAVKEAQVGVLDLASGEIKVTSSLESQKRSEEIKSNFTFLQSEQGKFAYCHTQNDRSDKIVFCEFSDGEKGEQWLIGKGWSVLGEIGYTKAEPHRFLKLLATYQDKKAIDTIISEETIEGVCHTVTLKPEILNETDYLEADISVVEQTIMITVDKSGKMTCYEDRATVLDKATEVESKYVLKMDISKQNEVKELTKPELRDYAPTKL